MSGRKLFVLTGASRGMGAALAEQLIAPDHVLLCIARRHNDGLAAQAEAAGVRCEQWALDLAEPVGAAARLQGWLGALDGASFGAATLVNNAAALTRIGPVDECSDVDLSAAMRVGLEAPLLLSAAFLRATRSWTGDKRILNISSGLGRRAMAGQASYCAAKAGMDHLTRAMALDEANRPNGARLVSLAPGVIDTDMQVQLRSGEAAGFPEKANFVGLKERGQLSSPADAAARLLAYLARPDFGANPVADVRDA
ncbi:SDR family NAD(P)-dependent oxidoreductase [Rhizobacter sp. Root404]|uniref:SDR family NAD(P)-dependent oxidoreductase n=1 Tax=Rhizobacter sp. Root404 TaxID=1736528 RepID=UPI0009E6A7C6|nr:SDR family NAD(P)-dependent oxidoreductase [Rhizobacter sp. Root404]